MIRRCCIKIIGGLICLPNRFGDLTIPSIHNKPANTVCYQSFNLFLFNTSFQPSQKALAEIVSYKDVCPPLPTLHSSHKLTHLLPDTTPPLPPPALRSLRRKEPVQHRATFMVPSYLFARDCSGHPGRWRLASFAGRVHGGRRGGDYHEHLREHVAERGCAGCLPRVERAI